MCPYFLLSLNPAAKEKEESLGLEAVENAERVTAL